MSRSSSFEVRCTEAEKAEWKQIAGARGLSRFVREAVIEKITASSGAPAAAAPPRVEPPALSDAELRRRSKPAAQRNPLAGPERRTIGRTLPREGERSHHPRCRCTMCQAAA